MTAATTSSVVSPPILPVGVDHDAPSWVLLDITGYIAKRRNATFAKTFASNGQPVEVTFSVAAPPLVSHFCVYCPGLGPADFVEAPKVIGVEADLVLFRLCVDPFAQIGERYFDYFLYTAHPQRPSLQLLPHPYPYLFYDSEVALLRLRCGDSESEYAIAALRNREHVVNEPVLFNLYLYRSSKACEGWTAKVVSVSESLRDKVCPVVQTERYHETTKVITLGGGTVGWVDLWRGILVCNVFDESPMLCDVPLPLPARGNWELYHRCGPYLTRDITVSPRKDAIKYVEVEICLPRKVAATTSETDHTPDSYLDWFHQKPRHYHDEDRGGWRATTWSLPVPITSWEDWHVDYTLDVADLMINPMHSKLLPKAPLRHGGKDDPTDAALLQGLITAFPTMSMDDDIVYLLSKASPMDMMEVVIAVDMRRKRLQGVAKLVPGKDYTFMRNCTSEISKYLNNKASGDLLRSLAILFDSSRSKADKETLGHMQKFTATSIPKNLTQLCLDSDVSSTKTYLGASESRQT